jgi:hypothetical protein
MYGQTLPLGGDALEEFSFPLVLSLSRQSLRLLGPASAFIRSYGWTRSSHPGCIVHSRAGRQSGKVSKTVNSYALARVSQAILAPSSGTSGKRRPSAAAGPSPISGNDSLGSGDGPAQEFWNIEAVADDLEWRDGLERCRLNRAQVDRVGECKEELT